MIEVFARKTAQLLMVKTCSMGDHHPSNSRVYLQHGRNKTGPTQVNLAGLELFVGGGGGGVTCQFKKWQCCMSLSLIYAHIACQIQEMAMSHFAMFFYPLSHVPEPNVACQLQKGRVALSTLRVEGHWTQDACRYDSDMPSTYLLSTSEIS